jgi:hypothetical protein
MNNIELLVIQDTDYKGMAVCLKPKTAFVITESITHEIRNLQDYIANNYYKNLWNESCYVIWYLHTGKIPWRGIDYSFIYNSLIEHKERKMESYITELFDLLFINHTGLGLPIINCSIITRPLTGLSQDFFLLNRINFIKNNSLSSTAGYEIMSFNQLKKKLYFPEILYSTNIFYSYNKFNSLKVQKILSELNYEPINKDKQVQIKEIFDKIKIKILHDIYELATTNMKLFERLARKQATEHKQALI